MWLTLLTLAALAQDSPSPSDTRPLRNLDEVGFELVFSYAEEHAKPLGSDGRMNFESRRTGAVYARLSRIEAYAGVDSFAWQGPAQGVLAVSDELVFSGGGGSAIQRETGSGVPVEFTITVHLDSKRGVYGFAFDVVTDTTVLVAGPGDSQSNPNRAGLSWTSPEFPLPTRAPSVSGSAHFSPELGGGELGTNFVPLGRTFKHMDGVALEEVHVHWLIERPGPRPELELTFEVEDYERWLPEGPSPGSSPETHGNSARVVARVARKDGGALERGAASLRFELTESSHEPGVCLNAPPQGAASAARDLRFVQGGDAAPLGAEGGLALTPIGDWSSASALVGAFDWGAWGALEVTAYVPRQGEVRGRFVPSQELHARLPKRAADSHVGDAWKELHGVLDRPDDDDDERTPGNEQHGDGFTLYEEYRGVFALERHSRQDERAALLPLHKDLVALLGQQPRSADGISFEPLGGLALVQGGFELFESATRGARVVPMEEREAPPTREINLRGLTHKRGGQYGVLLLRAPAQAPDEDGVALEVGGAYPLDRYPKSPQTTDWVAYDFTGMAAGYEAQLALLTQAGEPMPYTAAEEVDNTVAHELAHACGINHHGDVETRGPTRQPSELPAGTYHVYDHTGRELVGQELPERIQGSVAPDGSRASGDPTCILAYNNAYSWRLKRGGGYFWYAVLPGPMGTQLCAGADGDPPNVVFGPAASGGGNCRSKLKLRCYP